MRTRRERAIEILLHRLTVEHQLLRSLEAGVNNELKVQHNRDAPPAMRFATTFEGWTTAKTN